MRTVFRYLTFILFWCFCLQISTMSARGDNTGLVLQKDFQRTCLAYARSVLTRFVERQGAEEPATFPSEYKYPDYGVFITLEKGSAVRGCRGTLNPSYGDLQTEIACNTRGAASRDARFAPLQKKELQKVRISITIIQELAPLENVDTLKKAEGVVVMAGDRVGVVLPFEGSDPRIRCQWALKKGHINPDEGNVTWYILRGVRFKEEGVTP